MKVEVNGQKFNFPATCACCGAEATTSVPIVATREPKREGAKTKTMTFDFPYCADCKAHVARASAAQGMFGLGMLLGGFFFLYLWWKTGSQSAGMGIGLALLAVAWMIAAMLYRAAKAGCSPACTCAGKAVKFHKWYGFTYSFNIKSDDYARAFMLANQTKLVNVNSKLWSELHGGNPPLHVQTPRKGSI